MDNRERRYYDDMVSWLNQVIAWWDNDPVITNNGAGYCLFWQAGVANLFIGNMCLGVGNKLNSF